MELLDRKTSTDAAGTTLMSGGMPSIRPPSNNKVNKSKSVVPITDESGS